MARPLLHRGVEENTHLALQGVASHWEHILIVRPPITPQTRESVYFAARLTRLGPARFGEHLSLTDQQQSRCRRARLHQAAPPSSRPAIYIMQSCTDLVWLHVVGHGSVTARMCSCRCPPLIRVATTSLQSAHASQHEHHAARMALPVFSVLLWAHFYLFAPSCVFAGWRGGANGLLYPASLQNPEGCWLVGTAPQQELSSVPLVHCGGGPVR